METRFAARIGILKPLAPEEGCRHWGNAGKWVGTGSRKKGIWETLSQGCGNGKWRAAGQQKQRAGQAGTLHQGLWPKDSRVSSTAGETLWLQEQHLKKEGLKYRFAISPALKATQASSTSLFLPTALPAWLWHGTAGTNPCHHQRDSKFVLCSFTNSG